MNATTTATHYLRIYKKDPELIWSVVSWRDSAYFHYRVLEELAKLLEEWRSTTPDSDGLLSGIVADYLEDHWEELMTSDPTADAIALSRLIEDFRTKFNDRRRHNG